MMYRMLGRISDNPVMAGGLVVMALTATAIVSNAVFLQQSRHPDPLFSTRQSDAVEEGAPAPAPLRPSEIPTPRPRATALVVEPEPRPAPVPTDSGSASSLAGEAAIADLQRRLAEKGLYDGAIDGIAGSRTRGAIAVYQRVIGLPVTGEPDAETLDRIGIAVPLAAMGESSSDQPPPASDPAPADPSPVGLREAANEAGPLREASEPSNVAAPAEREATRTLAAASMNAATAAAREPAAAAEPSPVQSAAASRYRAVQHALNQIGYGPIEEDGHADAASEDAIRRFERDNGLAVTGEAGQPVIERLVAIGALEAI